MRRLISSMSPKLAGGHVDRTLGHRMREYTRPHVLIIDDFAMHEHTTTESDDRTICWYYATLDTCAVN